MIYNIGEKVKLTFIPNDIKSVEDLYHDASYSLTVKGHDTNGQAIQFSTASENLIKQLTVGKEINLEAKVKKILKRGDVGLFYVKEDR